MTRTASAGDAIVLKVAHPTDHPALVALNPALEHAHRGRPRIPIQSVVPTLRGDPAIIAGRVARVLTGSTAT